MLLSIRPEKVKGWFQVTVLVSSTGFVTWVGWSATLQDTKAVQRLFMVPSGGRRFLASMMVTCDLYSCFSDSWKI